MPAETKAPTFSLEEYRRLEEEAGMKFHWVAGEVLARPGGSPAHTNAGDALTSAIIPRLRPGKCRFLGSEAQVTDPGRTFFYYPDGLIACPPEYAPEDVRTIVTNPVVIFEILSPSTRAFDRGRKFRDYRLIPTFAEYVLIHPDEPRVEVLRAPEWETTVAEGEGAVFHLETVGLEVPLAEIYQP